MDLLSQPQLSAPKGVEVTADNQNKDSLTNMLQLFIRDIKLMDAVKLMGRSDMQTEKRSYIRAVFAFIEGTTFMMKQQALLKCPDCFSEAEKTLLLEESYDLNDKGEIRVLNSKLRTPQNIIFSFKALARSEGICNKFDTGVTGWEDLNKALKIRHRLTHPKLTSDLNVSADDLIKVFKAHDFYQESVIEILKRMYEKMPD